MRDPTEHEVEDFMRAVQPHFPPCTCHVLTGFGHYRVCEAHRWLTEVDKRSVPIARWQRLIFVRAMREHFEAQEGLSPEPTPPVDTRGRLPW